MEAFVLGQSHLGCLSHWVEEGITGPTLPRWVVAEGARRAEGSLMPICKVSSGFMLLACRVSLVWLCGVSGRRLLMWGKMKGTGVLG